MSYTQTIYNVLRKRGLTEAAALGMLGNWWCESNCEPFRMQGDFSSLKTASKAYVQNVKSGSITRDQFAHDSKGFGLAQWTYFSRKYDLYDYWKSSGKTLDDCTMQTEFAVYELETSFRALLDFLKSTNDVFTATSRICREYERPAVNNIDARYQAANRIKYEIDLSGKEDPSPQPTPQPAPKVDHSLQLRTIDRNCSGFKEVYLLKSLLLCRNYDLANSGLVDVDNTWTEALTKAVKEMQSDFCLSADGIVGQKTWDALMKR